MRRIVFALIATITAFLLAAAASPAATAQPDATISTDRTAATTAVEGQLPPHVIRPLKAFEIRNTGRFRVTGKAITYKNKVVLLKKSDRKVGGYRPYKRDRTSGDGRFRINFDGKIGTHFRLFLRETPRNRATTFHIGKIVRD